MSIFTLIILTNYLNILINPNKKIKYKKLSNNSF